MNNQTQTSTLQLGHSARPVLEPAFHPLFTAIRAYRQVCNDSGETPHVEFALERTGGAVSRWREPVPPPDLIPQSDTLQLLERIVKFLLWSRGAGTLHIAGPEFVTRHFSATYRRGGAREFDAQLMGRVYDREFQVNVCPPDSLPEEREEAETIGGFLDGCRIGFDLGASDFKLAAVQDGQVKFSTEIPWHPVTEKDPGYHLKCLEDGLKRAAAHLPRVDAIGGSSAGIYLDNQVMVASLFRSVPADLFHRDVKPMFLRLQKSWNVPLVVVNDGDVTALAGAMSLGKKPLLGIAMGSSEAAGYIDARGHILGWLNELAFAPVDVNPQAAVDEWSGDRGGGALYFSQQAVNRLAPMASINFPADMGVPDRLRTTQELVATGHPGAIRIFLTIGTYLAHTLELYRTFYDFDDVLILGRVTSGAGGEIMIEQAQRVLKQEYGQAGRPATIHVPDENNRRVGQAVAAASLPQIKR